MKKFVIFAICMSIVAGIGYGIIGVYRENAELKAQLEEVNTQLSQEKTLSKNAEMNRKEAEADFDKLTGQLTAVCDNHEGTVRWYDDGTFYEIEFSRTIFGGVQCDTITTIK